MTGLFFLIFSSLQLPAAAQGLPALPNCSAGCSEAQLNSIFDGSARPSLVLDREVPFPAPAAAAVLPPVLPQAVPVPPVPGEPVPALAGEEKGLTQDVLLQMDLYADKPSKEEKAAINTALGMLTQTQFGDRLCKSIRSQCTYEDLKKNGVEIRVVDDYQAADYEAAVTMPKFFGAWKVVTIRRVHLTEAKTGVAASLLSHELSHVEDLNTYGPALKNARLMTEDKALMSQLMIYNDLAVKFPAKFNPGVFEMVIALWRWKEEGAPFPSKLRYNGLTAQQFIDKYLDKFDCVDDLVKGLNRNMYYKDLKFAPTPGDVQSVGMGMRIRKDFRNNIIDYLEWREDNGKAADAVMFPSAAPSVPTQPGTPGYTVPPLPGTTPVTPQPQQPQPQQPQPQQPQPQQPQPQQPQPQQPQQPQQPVTPQTPQDDDPPSGGGSWPGGGSGAGGGHNPGNYNPTFPSGTWPTAGF